MIFYIIGAILIVLLAFSIIIVPEAHTYVVERFGVYLRSYKAGINIKIPVVDRISRKISLKEQVSDFQPQPVITKDNVTMMIDTVVYWQIFDPKMFAYGIERPISAIENLSATTLRNIIGDLTLDETLTSRDVINTKITSILDEATDKWGIKINRVEVKNIMPPDAIRVAMEKQMKAEREKREQILRAEGQKQAEITTAEGEKMATILRADAEKEKMIRLAEGKARALLETQKAEADALKLLNEANPSNKVIALKSLSSLEKVAEGNATKIIVPSDIANLSGSIETIKSLLEKDKN